MGGLRNHYTVGVRHISLSTFFLLTRNSYIADHRTFSNLKQCVKKASLESIWMIHASFDGYDVITMEPLVLDESLKR